jgi:hypothetical protein
MTKSTKALIAAGAMLLGMSSCTVQQRTIADSNSRVNFTAEDWAITPAYGGKARVTRVLGVDWQRFFTQRQGGASSISMPVVGWFQPVREADAYALYDMLNTHTGYDAIFYPQFKRKRLNVLGLYSRTESEVTARLGKLNAGTGEGDRESDK